MQQHVHAGHAQHGGVEIKTPEHVVFDVFAIRLKQIANVNIIALLVLIQGVRRGMGTVQIFHAAGQKAVSEQPFQIAMGVIAVF